MMKAITLATFALLLAAALCTAQEKPVSKKIVFGTDAVAGAHGRNAEEFIYRVQAGHPWTP